MRFFLLLGLILLGCSSVEKNQLWNEKAIFLGMENTHPVVELYASPSPENLAPPVKLRFLLDTGSNLSFLRKDFFPHSSKNEKFVSYTINGETEIEISKIQIRLETENSERLTSDHMFHMIHFKKDFPFDGIIGNDFLLKYTHILDFPVGIYFFPDDPKDLQESFSKINIYPEVKSHIIVPVQFMEKKIFFLLDTGAEISFIDEELIQSLNLKPFKTRKFVNLTGDLSESVTYSLPELCLESNFCAKNIEFLSNRSLRDFLGKNSIQISGIFGMNWIQNYYLLHKYPLGTLYLKKKGESF
ncbi:MAG: aspartyl protease family protein [Leptospiraceae bacterium]|nr:aspartyl protease family protein [Leptospiraceae bacterium]MCP5510611.1 aspartyl protease family protein [Leptospiraceae bacterium]